MAWGCLLLFYKNYIVYQTVYMFVWSELEVAIKSPSFVTLYLIVSEIAKCIVWGCLSLFYKNYIVYRMFLWSEFEVAITSPSFVAVTHSHNNQLRWNSVGTYCSMNYYNVYCYYCGVFTEKTVHTKFNLDWLLCECVTWPSTSLS